MGKKDYCWLHKENRPWLASGKLCQSFQCQCERQPPPWWVFKSFRKSFCYFTPFAQGMLSDSYVVDVLYTTQADGEQIVECWFVKVRNWYKDNVNKVGHTVEDQ